MPLGTHTIRSIERYRSKIDDGEGEVGGCEGGDDGNYRVERRTNTNTTTTTNAVDSAEILEGIHSRSRKRRRREREGRARVVVRIV